MYKRKPDKRYYYHNYCLRVVNPKKAEIEIDTISKMAEVKFGEDHVSHIVRFCTYLDWYKKRKDIFWLITCRQKIIGYIIMVPLNDQVTSGKRHFQGDIEEFQISQEMITDGLSKHILYQGGHLVPDYFDERDALDAFVNGIYRIAAHFMHKDWRYITETRIYAEMLIEANGYVFQQLGFVANGERNKAGKKMFEIYFADNNKTRKNKRWKEATRRIIHYIFNIEKKRATDKQE